jgi:primosomal protein N' (replication factor Y)
MERVTLFADVILPLTVYGTFTYRVPQEFNELVRKGQRVIVQFGKRRNYTGLIYKIHEQAPSKYEAKYILTILDQEKVVNDIQLSHWEWMTSYYLCGLGEVMNAALPSAFKLSSETVIMLHPEFSKDYSGLNEKEFLVADALEVKNALTITEISKILDLKKVYPVINGMIEKKVVVVEEEIKQRYKPRIETYVKLQDKFITEDSLRELFDKLEKKAPRQLEVLMAYISLSNHFAVEKEMVSRKAILGKVEKATQALSQLVKKKVFEIIEREVSRLKEEDGNIPGNTIEFNEVQETAFSKITLQLETNDVVLLHGITSSGKTEIYIKLIQETIAKGKQVLYLLPEIALTAQIINRLRKYFGDKVGVYHSRFSDNERVELWNALLSGNSNRFSIIVGARSAMFLPFSDLGLIIVDEEHDTSYKQNEPSPRYNARDAGIFLAKLHNAKTMLGSATPSYESYLNALSGKYGFVELMERYGGIKLPVISIVDMKEETKKRLMKSHFTSVLLENIGEALKNNEQVILFQNRRGFSSWLECDFCNWIPSCKFCDVSLTYHKITNQLCCHYCGYAIRVPDKCPVCSSTSIKTKGFGTEKIEDELPIFFPGARVARMDIDTTKKKNAYYNIIQSFEEREIDILVGTQMVTKGLDFENVSVVGILNADNMLSFPDFRAFERSFQLMSQVGGRAGRKNKQGKVIIQTYNPTHPVFKFVVSNDFLAFFHAQLREREKFKYPPYNRLIQLTIKHKNSDILNDASKHLAEMLRKTFGKRVLGPEYPMVSRIRNEFLKNILIKFEKDISLNSVKKNLMDQLISFRSQASYKSVIISIDVDPY